MTTDTSKINRGTRARDLAEVLADCINGLACILGFEVHAEAGFHDQAERARLQEFAEATVELVEEARGALLDLLEWPEEDQRIDFIVAGVVKFVEGLGAQLARADEEATQRLELIEEVRSRLGVKDGESLVDAAATSASKARAFRELLDQVLAAQEALGKISAAHGRPLSLQVASVIQAFDEAVAVGVTTTKAISDERDALQTKLTRALAVAEHYRGKALAELDAGARQAADAAQRATL